MLEAIRSGSIQELFVRVSEDQSYRTLSQETQPGNEGLLYGDAYYTRVGRRVNQKSSTYFRYLWMN